MVVIFVSSLSLLFLLSGSSEYTTHRHVLTAVLCELFSLILIQPRKNREWFFSLFPLFTVHFLWGFSSISRFLFSFQKFDANFLFSQREWGYLYSYFILGLGNLSLKKVKGVLSNELHIPTHYTHKQHSTMKGEVLAFYCGYPHNSLETYKCLYIPQPPPDTWEWLLWRQKVPHLPHVCPLFIQCFRFLLLHR
jgi:hypothetical protein